MTSKESVKTELKLYIIFEDEDHEKYGNAHEKIEDGIARYLTENTPFSGSVESEITGNTTRFGVGSRFQNKENT